MMQFVTRLSEGWSDFYRDHPDLVNSVFVGLVFTALGLIATKLLVL